MKTVQAAARASLPSRAGGSAGRERVVAACARAGILPLLPLSLAATALAAFAAAHQARLDSDGVQSMLAALSIVRGNVLLSGWLLARDNFFFTDTLPFAAFIRLFGDRTAALAIVPAGIYALIVALCVGASLRSLRLTGGNLAALAMALLLVGLPAAGLVYAPLLIPDAHGASCLFALATLLMLAALAKSPRLRDRPVLLTAFAATVFTAVMSDPYTLVFAFLPAMAVLGVEMLAGADAWRALRLLVLLGALCLLGASGQLVMVGLGGFFTRPSINTAFIPADRLGGNVVAFVLGLLYSSGADIFGGHAFAAGTIANATRFAAWLLGAAAVTVRLRRICRTGWDGLLDRLLLAAVVLGAAACVLSNMFSFSARNIYGLPLLEDGGSTVWIGGYATRYVGPIMVLAALLAMRSVPDMIAALPTRRFRVAAAGVLALAAAGLAVAHTRSAAAIAAGPSWAERNEYTDAARWLRARHLTCGVGDYWNASIFTVLTHGAVTVRPLDGNLYGALHPFVWIASARWYGGTTSPGFAIWRDGDDSTLFGFDLATVSGVYGTPLRVERFGRFTVAVLPPDPPRSAPTVRCPPAGGGP